MNAHWAASDGHIEAVKVLLDRGANVEAATDRKWTALYEAACGGYIKLKIV